MPPSIPPSLLASVVGREISTTYAAHVARTIEPGISIDTVSGRSYQVVGKQVSAAGTYLRLASQGRTFSVSVQVLAEMAPVSPAMRRLASFVHRVIAFDAALDQYVKQAILAAGLPIDKSMNWAKWLTKVYSSRLRQLTKDEDLIDDAIREIVVEELFEKRILDPNAPGYHFDASRVDADGLDKKVSAFLSMVFKRRVPQAVDFVKLTLGPGTKGEMGRAPTTSLGGTFTSEPKGDRSGLAESTPNREAENTLDASRENTDIMEMEGQNEVHAFLHAFVDYFERTERDTTVIGLKAVTEAAAAGLDRSEIKEKVLGMGLRGRDSEINEATFKTLMAKWSSLIKRFAADPDAGWSGTPVARMITNLADQLADGKATKRPAKAVTTSSLKLADMNPNLIQQQTLHPSQKVSPPPPVPPTPVAPAQAPAPAPNPVPAQVPPPPPVAPQAPAPVMDDGFQKPEEENPENPMPNQPKPLPHIGARTLAARIAATRPKVNIKVAAKEAAPKLPAPKKDAPKQAAPKPAPKRSLLRMIAEEAPQDMSQALDQLKDIVLGLGDSIDTIKDGLDLIEAPKEASVKARVASRNKFARNFRRIAEEAPEEFSTMLNDLYAQIEDVVDKVEILAENTEVDLTTPPAKETEEETGLMDEVEPKDDELTA
jgi:hypothetical protein